MNVETYWKCRLALDEANGALELVSTTDSPSIAAAACRRSLQVCFLLDREINQTVYPPDLEAAESMRRFQARHPDLFRRGSVMNSDNLLAAAGPVSGSVFATLDRDEGSLEKTYLPAARAIRSMLDEITTGLRKPHRHGLLFHAGVVAGIAAIAAAVLAIQWARMMASTEGLTVTYFKGVNLEKAVSRRVEKQIYAEYGDGRPAFFVPRNGYSARWDGMLVVPVTTNYSFYSQSEGGIRTYVDGSLVIDNWRERSWNASGMHGNKFLEAGNHRIVVEYFKNRGNGALRLRWAGGPIPNNTLVAVPYLKR